MTYCGVPRHMPDGSPLRRDPKSIHKWAEHAAKGVYQLCPSYSRNIVGHRQFLLETRDAIAAQFNSGTAEQSPSTAPSMRTSLLHRRVRYRCRPRPQIAGRGARDLRHALLIGLNRLGGFLEPVYPWAGWLAWKLEMSASSALLVL